MNAPLAPVVTPGRGMNMREARKELGLGQSPDIWGTNADAALAQMLSPTGRIEIVEVAQWRVDIPVADSAIPGTYGDRINVWGTSDGQPPQGVTAATNTLATPGVFPADMLIRGLSVRILVTPEGRLIPGNFVDAAGLVNLPASVDVATQNDVAGETDTEPPVAYNCLNLATLGQAEQSILPSQLLYGFPSWRVAYNLVLAYELTLLRNHQEQLIREPLTQVAHIEPFADAHAAGLAFACSQEAVLSLNERLVGMGLTTQQFMPVFFERYGSATGAIPLGTTPPTTSPGNVGVFTVSRERTAQSAVFGAIGIPQNRIQRDPYLFPVPVFWPHGAPMAIQFLANNEAYQAEFQRWLSLTGGVGGQQGRDLDLPFSLVNGLSGIMPSSLVPGVTTVEQTLDPQNPILVSQQTQTNLALLKYGPLLLEIGVIGCRMSNPAWGPIVARAIRAGAIMAPMGWGDLACYLQGSTPSTT